MTQKLIANTLGVRREGVTKAALKLQHAGLIRYARGHIEVLDRPALEKRVCGCYPVVKKEYDRPLRDGAMEVLAASSTARRQPTRRPPMI